MDKSAPDLGAVHHCAYSDDEESALGSTLFIHPGVQFGDLVSILSSYPNPGDSRGFTILVEIGATYI